MGGKQEAMQKPVSFQSIKAETPLAYAFRQMIPAAVQILRGPVRNGLNLSPSDVAVTLVVCVCGLPETRVRFATYTATHRDLAALEEFMQSIFIGLLNRI